MKNLLKNKKARILLLCAAILIVLAGVTVTLVLCLNRPEPPPPPEPKPPEVYTPHVLPAPTLTEDHTDYKSLALAVFEGVAPAPETDFTYEITADDTLRLLSYTGAGGTVVIPDTVDGKTVAALGEGLFRDSETLTALSIPESVTSIEKDLLTGCRTIQVLRTPQLGATREADGYLAYFFGADTPRGMGFKVSTSLDTVILQNTVTEIADLAMMDCDRLRMVLLPETLTSIGSFAFSGCSQLHFVPLPDSLASIGDYAFADNKALVSVAVPKSVEKIGLGAYMGCHSMEQISLPFIGEERNSEQLHHLGYIFGAEAYTWNTGFVPKSLVKVTLTEGNVPDYAFYECDNLALVTLPDGCESIGVRAFLGCDVLRTIVLPDSVASVGDLAFAHCVVLNGIRLNEGLTSIGIQAFMDCYSLTSLTLPDSLTAISNSAFADCLCLETVELGKGVEQVGDMAFRNCTSIKTASGGRADMVIGAGNETLAAVWQVGPSEDQIEQAVRAADHAVVTPRANKSSVDITIDLSDEQNLFPAIAAEHYYQRLYERSVEAAEQNGIALTTLMDVDHIKWEYELHLVGYRSGNKAIKDRCEKIDLNVEETVWSMIEKGFAAGN